MTPTPRRRARPRLLARAGVAAVGLLAGPLLVTVPPAAAAWSSQGSGNGRGAALTLPAPASVTATCAVPLGANLTWPAVPHASGYTVWRSSNGSTWTAVTSTAATSASDTSLATLLGLTLAWRVTATAGTSWTSPPSASSNSLLVNVLAACIVL